jgi:hypothetical protein
VHVTACQTAGKNLQLTASDMLILQQPRYVATVYIHAKIWHYFLTLAARLVQIFYVPDRVSDPHCFNADPDTDPDPAFFLIADPDPGSGSRV